MRSSCQYCPGRRLSVFEGDEKYLFGTSRSKQRHGLKAARPGVKERLLKLPCKVCGFGAKASDFAAWKC